MNDNPAACPPGPLLNDTAGSGPPPPHELCPTRNYGLSPFWIGLISGLAGLILVSGLTILYFCHLHRVSPQRTDEAESQHQRNQQSKRSRSYCLACCCGGHGRCSSQSGSTGTCSAPSTPRSSSLRPPKDPSRNTNGPEQRHSSCTTCSSVYSAAVHPEALQTYSNALMTTVDERTPTSMCPTCRCGACSCSYPSLGVPEVALGYDDDGYLYTGRSACLIHNYAAAASSSSTAKIQRHQPLAVDARSYYGSQGVGTEDDSPVGPWPGENLLIALERAHLAPSTFTLTPSSPITEGRAVRSAASDARISAGVRQSPPTTPPQSADSLCNLATLQCDRSNLPSDKMSEDVRVE